MLKRWTVVILTAAIGSLLFLSCPANWPPRIVSFDQDPTAPARSDTVSVTCHAVDDDGDTLIFEWKNYGGALLEPTNDSIVSWIAPTTTGNYRVWVNIRDNRGGFISDTVDIAIAAPSRVFVSIDTNSAPGTISLRWTRNLDTDFLRYEIYSSQTKGSLPGGGTLDTSIIDQTDTTYTIRGLVANQTYYFMVVVVNEIGYRSNSNEASEMVQSLPPTPITLYTPKYIETTAIRLVWSQNPDNDFTKYEVFCSTNPGFNPDTLTRVTTFTRRADTTYLVTNLNPKTMYYFKIMVTNTGSLSDTSNEVSTKTTAIYSIGAGAAKKLDLSMPGYAFVAASVLTAFNVITPEHPAWYGSLSLPDQCYHLFVSAVGETSYVYLAYGTAGLVKANVTNPAVPLVVATMDTGWVNSVYKDGDFVYFGTYYDSKYYFAVTDAATLTFLNTIPMPDRVSDIFVYNNYAYLACNYGGLRIINVSNPYLQDPQEISHITFQEPANGIYLYGTTAYIATGSTGLISVDISQPNLPRVLDTLNTPGYAQDVFVVGNYAYVADGQGGLQKVWIGNGPENMELVMTYAVPYGDIWDVRVTSTHAFLADYTGSFEVLAW